MLNTKKNISKSVRLTEEVFNYIDNFDGDGFNQKLENLVLFCMKDEDLIKTRIGRLENNLLMKSKMFQSANRGMDEIYRALSLIDDFNVRLSKIVEEMILEL